MRKVMLFTALLALGACAKKAEETPAADTTAAAAPAPAPAPAMADSAAKDTTKPM